MSMLQGLQAALGALGTAGTFAVTAKQLADAQQAVDIFGRRAATGSPEFVAASNVIGSNNLGAGLTPEALDELTRVAAFLPGGTLKLTDLANEQNFRQGQSARIGGQIQDARDTRANVTGETRAQRDKSLAPLDAIIRREGNIISQKEVDQMAARLIEQNNAASQNRMMALEDRAAATGAAPGALSESRRREDEGNAAANATAVRDLDIANALNRAQTLLQATGQRGNLALGFQNELGNQELAFMDLIRSLGGEQAIFDQPVQFSPMANEATALLDTLLARRSGAESNLGAQFAALSQNLPALFEQQAQIRAAEAARPKSSPFEAIGGMIPNFGLNFGK